MRTLAFIIDIEMLIGHKYSRLSSLTTNTRHLHMHDTHAPHKVMHTRTEHDTFAEQKLLPPQRHNHNRHNTKHHHTCEMLVDNKCTGTLANAHISYHQRWHHFNDNVASMVTKS